jgi:hypothetical protein
VANFTTYPSFMKHSLLILISGLLLSTGLQAQTTRLQLYEVFSGENCPPCAPTNVYLHNLAVPNTEKIIMIKYQVNIPSAGPIYFQNSTDPTARRTYYGVTSAPNARHDGTIIGTGHGQNLTQAIIDQRVSTPSPFSINLSHSFNSNRDSVFMTMTVTATQAVASGTWVGHLALIEKHMSYPTPPGTNGETDFYNVVRKMYPSASGSALPGTWTAGQTETVSIAAAVPTYIRDLAEVAVVGFVQNNTTKEVAQTEISEPLPVPLYSQAIFNDNSFYRCSSAFNPVLTVENLGTTPLTTMAIRQIIGTNSQLIQWTGNLAPGASTNISLNPTTLASGTSNYTFRIDSMNGVIHPSAVRATVTGSLYFSANAVTQATNTFTGAFPPANFAVRNQSSGTNGWTQAVQGANGSQRSARINFWDIAPGEINDLYIPRLNLSAVGAGNALKFYLAHAQYNASSTDRLDIEVSTDCGLNWSPLYTNSGPSLATVAPVGNAGFVPTSAADWRQESVSLDPVAGQSNVLIRFRGISDYGNNLYIDEINVPVSAVAVEEIERDDLAVTLFPNPVRDLAIIRGFNPMSGNILVTLRNTLGQVVSVDELGTAQGAFEFSLPTSLLNEGVYTAEVRSGQLLSVRRLVRRN